ncbi:hypothetical protein NLU13_1754 [Sarocladium strictum]|uniref:HypA n=1 Tax=Sarocladium strictum TaxID=5046 RepID=A0AA39GRJ4_SARSR|nr:hypothetical protein NLU13_1754 [Sarocladium strictum]
MMLARSRSTRHLLRTTRNSDTVYASLNFNCLAIAQSSGRRPITTGAATMATPYHIHVKPSETGLLHLDRDEQTATKVSELLQDDLEKHHVFFNASGYHDHITHHLLTLYGTGASASDLQNAYRQDASYQLRAQKPRPKVLDALRNDWNANARDYLGKGKHYAEFLQFFQEKIEANGWQATVQEHLFSDNPVSKDVFARLFAGLYHPMIQLMYGLEWQQPAIIAQGLAQASVHLDRLTSFFTKAEQMSQASPSASSTFSLPELLERARTSGKLSRSAKWNDDKPLNGVLARAEEEALDLVSQVKINPGDLEEKTVEMMHTAAYVAAAAAFHEPYIPRMDFFLIHTLTSSPFFLTINKLGWVPNAQKVRLLEWKMRLDIVEYIAQGCPPLDTASLRRYTPRDPTQVHSPWSLLPKFHSQPDDGHTIKVIRSLILAEQESKKYEDKKWIRIKDAKSWLNAHHVMLDSMNTEADTGRWVRGAGFSEAWEGKPKV